MSGSRRCAAKWQEREDNCGNYNFPRESTVNREVTWGGFNINDGYIDETTRNQMNRAMVISVVGVRMKPFVQCFALRENPQKHIKRQHELCRPSPAGSRVIGCRPSYHNNSAEIYSPKSTCQWKT